MVLKSVIGIDSTLEEWTILPVKLRKKIAMSSGRVEKLSEGQEDSNGNKGEKGSSWPQKKLKSFKAKISELSSNERVRSGQCR
jgi:hypothetical protein